ncbi:MAG: beta-hexosaminidase [Albidovulum sp.]|nr:beta-hexosaminidase [Albidovulum sp.]MDE0306246.1 beta-hexosaminidase [Albidovulum sp.]MDE0531288.1 beta-hexosaminidase [Albidovulum sp.]
MAYGAYLFGCGGPYLELDEAKFFSDSNPFGFILFSRNVESQEQLRRLTGDLRDAVGRDAPILVDQEGGRVQRLPPPLWRDWPSPLEQCEGLAEAAAARAMWIRYRLISSELRDCGINSNCVPMADVATKSTHPVVKDRCYGYHAERVARLARAAAEGTVAGGVLPVLKHIPGHGRPFADSHVELPRTSASLDELDSVDFYTFSTLSDLPLGMTAHVVYKSVDRDHPATQSPSVIKLIRERIGFNGLLMTDDISMSALSGGIEERCVASIGAGCDLVLHCNGNLDEMKAVAEAAGDLTKSARVSADCVRNSLRAQLEPLDAAELDKEFRQILRTKSN